MLSEIEESELLQYIDWFNGNRENPQKISRNLREEQTSEVQVIDESKDEEQKHDDDPTVPPKPESLIPDLEERVKVNGNSSWKTRKYQRKVYPRAREPEAPINADGMAVDPANKFSDQAQQNTHTYNSTQANLRIQ